MALVPALLVAVLTRNNDSSTALDSLNQWLNLLQSVQLPFALIPVLAFNASKTLMGKFANSRAMVAGTVAISLLVMLINVSGVLAFAEAGLTGANASAWMVVAGLMVLYLTAVGYLFVHATAAAGLLPPFLGGLADQPGGRSSDNLGGGRFERVPMGTANEGLLTVMDEEGGLNLDRNSSRLSAVVADRECRAPGGSVDSDTAEDASVVGVVVATEQSQQQLQQPLLPRPAAAWQPDQ